MKPILAYYNSTKSHRDAVLDGVLDLVKPQRIIEVGTTRNLAKFARFTDGWATIRFAQHLAITPRQPGSVTPDFYVADVNDVALKIAVDLATETARALPIYGFRDGIEAITESVARVAKEIERLPGDVPPNTLVYLDGDDSKWGMKDQMEWCDPYYMSILCDDFDIKGFGVKETPELMKNAIPFEILFDYRPSRDWFGKHSMMFRPSDALLKTTPFEQVTEMISALAKQAFKL